MCEINKRLLGKYKAALQHVRKHKHYAKLIISFSKLNIYLAEESKNCDGVAINIHFLKSLKACETEVKQCIKCEGGGGSTVQNITHQRRCENRVRGQTTMKKFATCLEKEEDLHI